MKIGFTGTRHGMTDIQKHEVRNLLTQYRPYPWPGVQLEAHHGRCVGADEEFNNIARTLMYDTIGWPANNVDEKNKSHCLCTTLHEAAPALIRNHYIVDACKQMIACPYEYEERWRGSGTWAAIRYAKKVKKPLCIIYPDGSIDRLNNSM